jgi:hypothetical protein
MVGQRTKQSWTGYVGHSDFSKRCSAVQCTALQCDRQAGRQAD